MIKTLIDRLEQERVLSKQELVQLLDGMTPETSEYLFQKSRAAAQRYYGNQVYMRGLIEISNYCKNDCYYCGIRNSNTNAERYRLSEAEILQCCANGYALGFRTFVLQGGEDGWFTDQRLVSIVSQIRQGYPDCAITLSLGERSHDSYQQLFDAGANRYLLRHETANEVHFSKLHPKSLRLENRKQALFALKEIGYQVGSGFMVGSPYQTTEYLAEDLLFLQELTPHMVGIGPFVPCKETPFAEFPQGSLELTLYMIGILRLLFPNSLIPATTALGTIHPTGREQGILAGANVVMPNLSPVTVRKKYALYNNKIATGAESAEGREGLSQRMQSIGYELVLARGDCKAE